MIPQAAHRLRVIFGLITVLILLLPPASALAQDSGTGFYYVVRPGDTWSGISHTLGVSVATIKEYNPAAIHPHDYLWIGDRLWIPAPEPEHATTGYWYSVKQGNDWDFVSRATGVSVPVLKAANPIAAADPHDWLYIGQQLWIPTGAPAESETSTEATPAAAETTETPGVTMAPEATAAPSEISPGAASTPEPETRSATPVEATPTPTSQPEPTPEPLMSVEPTASVEAAAAPSPEATAVAETEVPPTTEATPEATSEAAAPIVEGGCPADPAAFPDAIAIYLNGSDGDVAALKGWLQGCGLITAEAGDAVEMAVPDAEKNDVVVVIRTSAAGELPHDQLLVYQGTTADYALVYQAEGVGEIKLLQTKDINADGKPDLVYSDTSCGAHTCFSTLFVESWNGTAFQDWIKGNPTMAGAEYSFMDTVPAGEGEEILAHGGLINSAGAGPQRAWTETYVSPEGGPYESYKKAYDESNCLYFQILDANELFNQWNSIGFAPAVLAYDKAVADETAKACGTDPDELDTLRNFARFRLVVSWVSRGRSDKAVQIRSEITYQPLAGAADIFLKGVQNSHSIVQACRDTTKYAEENPGSWIYLSDWGYANPTFTAADLCPLGQ
jgi:LysM repeat protein